MAAFGFSALFAAGFVAADLAAAPGEASAGAFQGRTSASGAAALLAVAADFFAGTAAGFGDAGAVRVVDGTTAGTSAGIGSCAQTAVADATRATTESKGLIIVSFLKQAWPQTGLASMQPMAGRFAPIKFRWPKNAAN